MNKEDKKFFETICRLAEEQNTFNPHLTKQEIMEGMGIDDEGKFNILRDRLGNSYCRSAGPDRCVINMSACLKLKEEKDRHNQILRLILLTTILGALLASLLNYYFGA